MEARRKAAPADVGAAMLTWYAAALRQFPDGLVSQAQAATMLAVNRMAVSRLVARGHLRAVYFPRPPDVAGVAAGRYDPRWLALAERLGISADTGIGSWPKACYVSFGDVIRLWRAAPASKALRADWHDALAEAGIDQADRPPAPAPRGGEPETWLL